MPPIFRSLRGFAIFFLISLLILLIARMVVGRLAMDAEYNTLSQYSGAFEPTQLLFQGFDTILLLLSLLATVVLIIFLLVLVFSIVRWAMLAILNTPTVASTQTLNRVFGIVAVAAFFGSLVDDLYTIARNQAVNLFSTVPSNLTDAFRNGMGCIENNMGLRSDYVDSICISTFFFDATRTVRGFAFELFGSSGLARIDPVSVIAALAVFLLVTIVSSRVRSDLETKEQFWIAYGCVAFFATYLTLSALLAVPLLSEKEGEPPRTSAELQTNLEKMWSAPAAEPLNSRPDEAKLQTLFAEGAISLPKLLEDENSPDIVGWLAALRATARGADGLMDRLEARQVSLNKHFEQSVRNNLSAAVLAYDSEVSVRRGQREANRHFVDLTNWFQFVVDEQNFALSGCRNAIQNADRVHSDSIEILSRVVERGNTSTQAGAQRLMETLSRRLEEERSVIVNSIRDAEQTCDSQSNGRFVPPSRSDYGSFLGVVGTSVSWLLSTESMEVALLTGLIGFGLLGAMVAQFVKSGGVEKFEIAQIATIVFSGFCAAIVVYVAAYGGLAITSMSGDDPNPYVVFAACLIGAVYSAEIWARAKKWMISGSNDS